MPSAPASRAILTPRRKAAAVGSRCSCASVSPVAPAAGAPSSEWSRSTAKSSPVTNVVNAVSRPSRTRHHFEWVPGSTTCDAAARSGARASAPQICVSSPRITSGSRSGRVVRSPFTITPGTMWSTPCPVSQGTSAAASNPASVGQSTYGTSRQPCRLPTMPQATAGSVGTSVSQSPTTAVNAAPNPPSGRCRMPQGRVRVSMMAPSDPKRCARSDEVPQSRPTSAGFGRSSRAE